MSTVAFIGLGAMGSRMAMNLHAAGHKLRVYNRDKAKTKPFAEKGIEVCDSPAAAAKGAEFVCSIVADDIATRAVMLGADGKSGAVGAAGEVDRGAGRWRKRRGRSGRRRGWPHWPRRRALRRTTSPIQEGA